PTCPRYERYTCCKTCLEPTCRNRNVVAKCAGPCTGGCVCKPGLVRVIANGKTNLPGERTLHLLQNVPGGNVPQQEHCGEVCWPLRRWLHLQNGLCSTYGEWQVQSAPKMSSLHAAYHASSQRACLGTRSPDALEFRAPTAAFAKTVTFGSHRAEDAFGRRIATNSSLTSQTILDPGVQHAGVLAI
uniref:TIL domain-containing protein n=1 Tax=Anopheles dirus TaxID=7168 RepID=A0A182NFI5_9DIPT